MTTRVLIALFAVAVAIVAPPSAFAGGPNDPPCTVPNVSGGASAIRGTIAVGVQDAVTQGNTDVDFTLRLERGGALVFFRTSVNRTIFARSNECVLRDLFVADTTVPAILDLRAAILSAFGFPSTAQFIITDKALSKAEVQGGTTPQWLCNNTFTSGDPSPLFSPCPGQPPRGASMADVTINVK
jgi:hypothetical protein